MKSENYILLILIIFLNLSAICGVDFENHDFEGNFQMEVPRESCFEKTSSFFGLDIGNTKVYQDFENNINISYESLMTTRSIWMTWSGQLKTILERILQKRMDYT